MAQTPLEWNRAVPTPAKLQHRDELVSLGVLGDKNNGAWPILDTLLLFLSMLPLH